MKQILAKERQKYLNDRLRHIVKHAYHNAPTIKRKFDAAGVKPWGCGKTSNRTDADC